MTGLPSLPVHHSTATGTPTPAPGIEAVSGDLIALGVGVIVAAALVFAVVLYLHTITRGRLP
jgi:hypothetical protein